MLFAQMANAAPVCYYQSSEVVRGHANTYISAANPAVGDYIGTMQELKGKDTLPI